MNSGFFSPAYQDFIDNRDWSGLVAFYSDLLAEEGGSEMVELVNSTLGDLGNFKASLESGYREAISLGEKDAAVKAVYFEYYFDGGESSHGNFFLCSRYSDALDDDWFAHFLPKGVVSGPMVGNLLNFGARTDIEPDDATYEYAHARFLSCFGSVWEKERSALPVGFSRHEGDIAHFNHGN